MEIDYKLFQEEEDKKDHKSPKYEKQNKIFYISFLLMLLCFIIFYLFITNESKEIKSKKNNEEIIVFVNKLNKTTKSSSNWKKWKIDKFSNIFNIWNYYSIYDDYIGTPYNITNKIKEFFNVNITTDIFDLNNYIRIRDYFGLDFDLNRTIKNGIMILSFISGDTLIDMVFDNKYFERLRKYKNILKLNNVAKFISLCFITFFGQSLSFNEIQQSIIDWYEFLGYDNIENNNQTLMLK